MRQSDGGRVFQFVKEIGRRSWARRAAWCVGALLVFWALAWVAVPPIARSQIERLASEALGREVTVARVDFSPWTLEMTLHGLSIASQGAGEPQAQVERIYIDAELQSLWRLAPVIDAIEVDGPVLRVAQTSAGYYDVDDILARFSQPPEPEDPQAKPARFALYNMVLRGGSVDFDDRTVDKVHTLRQVRLDVPFLSNLSADREVKVTPRLAFELNGSAFDSAAQATPFADDREAEARVRIQDFDLAPFAGYIPHSVPLRLRAGVLDADLRVHFEQAAAPRVKIAGSLALRGAETTDAQGGRLLGFDALRVVLKDVQPLQHQVDIESVDWEGVRALLRRDASGAVVLPGMEAAAPAEAPAASAEAPWQFRLGRLSLRDGVFDWEDESLPGGRATWKADQLRMDATAIAWPLHQPLQFQASAQLSGGGVPQGGAQLALQGQATGTRAQAAVSIRGLPVAMAGPYLAGVLKPSVAGTLDADIGLARDGEVLAAKVARLSLDKASLSCPSGTRCETLRHGGVAVAAKSALVELGRLEVADAWVLPSQRRLSLARVALQQPRLLVSRSGQGGWMFEEWLAVQQQAPQAASAGAGAPWSVQVESAEIAGADVAFRDAAAPRPVALNLSALQLRASGFAWRDGKMAPFPVHLQTRAGAGRAEAGQLTLDATLSMAPGLALQGKVRARNLPLHAFEPYVSQDLNVDIRRADGSFTGDVRYADAKAGPSVAVKGDLSLDDVRVLAADGEGSQAPRVAEQGEELLRWKSLGLRGVALGMEPGKPLTLDVQETALSDFFARIIVQESGRINLQDIRKEAAAAEPQEAREQATDPLAPVIRFGPVALANGAVHFTDHFIKPNYSANISDLGGRLSAFSSVATTPGGEPQMADLELRGRAQGTASLEVTGKLNPLAKPLALDIQGRMRDLELPPLSPYSIKYAGHGIERGKLSMDVAYKVQPDGQLTASNKLVLNQLAFSDPVEGAPASLPVRLATALLADRNGVIDVDLPVSGSLNDPQFRLGAVILKVIGNLIMKAVTAPFSLLAGAFGGGDEQGAVAFAAGSAALDDGARQQLDKMAQALVDRPALRVTVVGWAQPQAEQEAWKRLRLRDLTMAQKRRTAVRDGGNAAEVTPVSDAEYPALLKEVYRRADIKKPRNLVGIAKDLPQPEMEALLLQSIAVPGNAMQELALARGVAVRDYLASRQVPLERLFVGASKLTDDGAQGNGPKAELTLAAR